MEISWLDKVIYTLARRTRWGRSYDNAVFIAKVLVAGTLAAILIYIILMLQYVFGIKSFSLLYEEWFVLLLIAINYLMIHVKTGSAKELEHLNIQHKLRLFLEFVLWVIIVGTMITPFIVG